MTGNIRIGISGWTYKPWRGAFYPEGLRQADELRFASRALRTIEINGTFYSLQKPESFRKWHDETPDDFVFSVKAPRYITHIRRLRDVEIPVANFFASGPLRLGRKLGPVLWQFPASMKFDSDLFETFFAFLPHDMKEAAALAKRHDGIVNGRAWLEVEENLPVRHAVEIRNDGFADERFLRLLKTYKIALVCADTVKWPRLMDVTADFIYCRLHGAEELYASGYDEEAIAFWQKHVAVWAEGSELAGAERIGGPVAQNKNGRDVFVYFDNDMKVRAPHDAARLAKLFGFDGGEIIQMVREGKQVTSQGQNNETARHEAGVSNKKTPAKSRKNLKKTKTVKKTPTR